MGFPTSKVLHGSSSPSRNNRPLARTGRSLEFQYDMVEGAWHHIGKSTAGEPMHEVWNRRKELGI